MYFVYSEQAIVRKDFLMCLLQVKTSFYIIIHVLEIVLAGCWYWKQVDKPINKGDVAEFLLEIKVFIYY